MKSSNTNSTISGAHKLTWVAVACLGLLAGCGALEEQKVEYRNAKRVNNLDVPPDLSQLTRDSRYALPGPNVSAANAPAAATASGTAATAPSSAGDVRIERSGQQRWLVVNRPPEVLWNNVREFWKDSGFELAVEQEALGVLETEWTENRSKLPQDFIRSTIGRLFDGLYSTGERDKFRTRLERNAEGKTEIYITHRGLEEVYTSEAKDKTTWQPRANDLGLESEFLRRLMLKLGAPSAQAQALSSVPPISKAAQVIIANGAANLALNDSFDTTWRRVGLALDRTGFTVEDRNRAEGRYFVRYVPNSAGNTEKPKEGFFARLFSSKKTEEIAPARYQITVKAQGTQTLLSVLNTKGEPEATGVAQRILEVIAADLK